MKNRKDRKKVREDVWDRIDRMGGIRFRCAKFWSLIGPSLALGMTVGGVGCASMVSPGGWFVWWAQHTLVAVVGRFSWAGFPPAGLLPKSRCGCLAERKLSLRAPSGPGFQPALE